MGSDGESHVVVSSAEEMNSKNMCSQQAGSAESKSSQGCLWMLMSTLCSHCGCGISVSICGLCDLTFINVDWGTLSLCSVATILWSPFIVKRIFRGDKAKGTKKGHTAILLEKSSSDSETLALAGRVGGWRWGLVPQPG